MALTRTVEPDALLRVPIFGNAAVCHVALTGCPQGKTEHIGDRCKSFPMDAVRNSADVYRVLRQKKKKWVSGNKDVEANGRRTGRWMDRQQ